MPSLPLTTPIEILEARIAPALFYVSGTSLQIFDKNGFGPGNDSSSASAAHATYAFLLHKGDSLIYDTNGNLKLDAKGGDYTMLTVTAGNAEVFFKDLNGNAKFEKNEFTGIAVTNGFKGTLNGDLNGSLATLLDSSNAFTPTVLQPASIAGLTLNGHILGNVAAGGNITGITAKVPAGSDPLALSITGAIYAGTAANSNSFDLNGPGGTGLSPTYLAADGEAGASISKITLPGGVSRIQAGSAGSIDQLNNPNNLHPKGGSISGIILGGLTPVGLSAGRGGTVPHGVSGPGGDIINVKIKTFDTESVVIVAGDGGSVGPGATDGGQGGDGGKISGVSLTVLGTLTGSVEISGGPGGQGGAAGAGGNGGAVEKSSFVLGYQDGATLLTAIHGGDGGDAGRGISSGGNGGALTNVTLLSHGSSSTAVDSLYLYGGIGGKSGSDGPSIIGNGAGGAGGNITGLKVTVDGVVANEVRIVGGLAGDVAANLGSGGRGGGVSNSSVTVLQAASLTVSGALGGSAGSGGGNGGDGGNINGVTVTALGRITSQLAVSAGDGGLSAGSSTSGGHGGSVTGVTVNVNAGAIAVSISAGSSQSGADTTGKNGGSLSQVTVNNRGSTGSLQIATGLGAGSSSGAGGAGGDLTGLTVNNRASIATISLLPGSGGDSPAGGPGGRGGNLSKVTFNNLGAGGNLVVAGGAGGAGASGGNGSSITGLQVKAPHAFGSIEIRPGSGGASAAAGGHGGDASTISNITINAPFYGVGIDGSFGHGGNATNAASGGNGGMLSNLSGTVRTLTVQAATGGTAVLGAGGAGGFVTGLKFTVQKFADIIRAGDGGNSSSGAGGAGGSLYKIKIVGDIGDFSSSFGFVQSGLFGGMGGLAAGEGGAGNVARLNGTIDTVSATRIAAIVAGAPQGDALTADNAVRSINNVKAKVIGADLNFDGVFAFDENTATTAGYQLHDAADNDDRALDGLVLVKNGAITGVSVTPLKLVQV